MTFSDIEENIQHQCDMSLGVGRGVTTKESGGVSCWLDKKPVVVEIQFSLRLDMGYVRRFLTGITVAAPAFW